VNAAKTRRRKGRPPSRVEVGQLDEPQPSGQRSGGGVNRSHLLLLLVVAALVFVFAPALRAPVALDDYPQRAMIEGTLIPHRSPFNLYALVDDGNRAAQLARGALPWWSDAALKVSFLRPLPSALIWFDYQQWGYGGFFPHVHSLLWWAVAVFATFQLFSQLFSHRAALVGAIIFALSPAHMLPILWLANRNALVTVAFGTWALAQHVQWRDNLTRRDGMRSLALWALTLLSGEYALGFTGYVLAIELFRRGDSRARRVLAVATYAVPALLYLMVRAALGYGVSGSGLYASPFNEPARVIANAPRALGTLLASLWCCVDEAWSTTASPEILAAAVAALALLLATAIHAACRRLDRVKRDHALWLLIGSLLALLPVLPARASTRFLGVAALGASAVVGIIIEAAWTDRRRLGQSNQRSVRGVPALGVIGSVIALGLTYAYGIESAQESHEFASSGAAAEEAFDRSLDFIRARGEERASTLVVLRGITPPTALTIPFMLHDAAPERFRALTETTGRITVARPGPTVLVITPVDGNSLLRYGTTDPTRAKGMHVDDAFSVPGMRVTVLAVSSDQEPLALRFDFERDLNDPSFHWLIEGANGFRDATIPPVGKQLNVGL
jgi:uncharacterized membrane protein YdcZ (DUF606 family)